MIRKATPGSARRAVSGGSSIASNSFWYASRSAGDIGCAPNSFSRNSLDSSAIDVSVLRAANDFPHRLLAVMQARFHRPQRHAQHVGDLLHRQIAQEKQRHRLALRQGEL